MVSETGALPARDQENQEDPRRVEIDEIGRLVKAARSERNWSLRRLADAAGVSASLLSAVENGKVVPTVASLFAISDALDRPAETFFPTSRRPAPLASESEAAAQGTSSLGHRLPSTSAEPEGIVEPQSGRAVRPGFRRRPAPGQAPAPTPAREGRSVVRSGEPDRAPSGTRFDLPGGSAASVASKSPDHRSSGRERRRSRVSRRAGSSAGPAVRGQAAAADPAAGSSGNPVLSPRADRLAYDAARSVSNDIPGVTRLSATSRPTMNLGGGQHWSLVYGSVDITVIEVTLAGPHVESGLFRSHPYAIQITVLNGLLGIEAGFGRSTIESGDSAEVRSNVPHRFRIAGQSDGSDAVRFLIVVLGEWDGTV